MSNPSFRTSESDNDAALTGKIGIQQQLGPRMMAYATYSRGHKGKAFDLTSSFDTPDSPARNAVNPEKSDSFEIGLKGSGFDHRLRFSAALFSTKYNDFQAQSVLPGAGGSSGFFLTNVGSVRTRGVELEWLAKPVDDFSINGSATYDDAKILSFPKAACYSFQTAAGGCINGTQDLSGKKLANAPKWKINIGADLKVPLRNMPFDGFVNVNYTWQSSTNFSLSQDPATFQKGYGILNATVGVLERSTALTDCRYLAEIFSTRDISQIS
jgi:iron complex outermembrane recepter protein